MTKPRQMQVAVFGAGIAGLTAAHELVERGYAVEVYEKAPPSIFDEALGVTCGIGGVAATQWNRVEPEESSHDYARKSMLQTQPITRIRPDLRRIRYDRLSPELDSPVAAASSSGERAGSTLEEREKLAKDLEELAKQLAAHARDTYKQRGSRPLRVFIDAFQAEPAQPINVDENTEPDTRVDVVAAKSVLRLFTEQMQAHVERGECELVARALGLGHASEAWWRDEQRFYVEIWIDERILPGDHGFRFFPAFYRNLFDTLRRIPIATDQPDFVETSRTVMDSLVATDRQAVNLNPADRSFSFSRRPWGSLAEVLELVGKMETRLGFTAADVARLQLKLFQYATSSRERREQEYENQSWWDFLDGDRFSPQAGRYLDDTGQTLVAMRAKECDARTYGSIVLQMLADQTPDRSGRPRAVDATLNGPTSVAWFDHWRRYLVEQGVRFIRGELLGFTAVGQSPDGTENLFPVVALLGPPVGGQGDGEGKDKVNPDNARATSPSLERFQGHQRRPTRQMPGFPLHAHGLPRLAVVMRDYFVLALPPQALIPILDKAREDDIARPQDPKIIPPLVPDPRLEIFGDKNKNALQELLVEFPDDECGNARRIRSMCFGDPTCPDPAVSQPGALGAHMSGIQFFFRTDPLSLRGHVDFADSAWGLSAISQPQFWERRRGWWSGYLGLLSVDICEWNTPGTELVKKTAWECSDQELAIEVWAQIRRTLPRDQFPNGEAGIPYPAYFHVDEHLRPTRQDGKSEAIRTNDWLFLMNPPGQYPERPGKPGDYRLSMGRYVFAGSHMQTHVRMTTMEAANESARHAVNAILRDLDSADADSPDGETKTRYADSPARDTKNRYKGALCRIYELDGDDEPSDLSVWRRIDQELLKQGLPHLVEVLGWPALPAAVLQSSGDPLGALGAATGAGFTVVDAIRQAVGAVFDPKKQGG